MGILKQIDMVTEFLKMSKYKEHLRNTGKVQ